MNLYEAESVLTRELSDLRSLEILADMVRDHHRVCRKVERNCPTVARVTGILDALAVIARNDISPCDLPAPRALILNHT